MSPTLLLAGGGTGGHVFPMVAVGHALRRLRPDIRLVFVGTERGMETRVVPEQGFELELLEVLPIRGGGLRGVVRGVTRAAATLPASLKLLDQVGPQAVFSVGGYAAGPVSAAARLRGLPLALLEPNSAIGLANLMIAPFVDRAYTAFEPVERFFSPAAVLPAGVPLRPGFDAAPYRLEPKRMRILVLGGSQGAKMLNEALPEALSRVHAPIEVMHQCGRAHIDDVRQRYRQVGASFAEVTPFIDDMPAALRGADLVIGRSGAGAVSEITAVGRPSVLVPYPYASGDHQMLNARCLEQLGAAVCVPNAEAGPDRLLAEIEALCVDATRLIQMADAARQFGRPHAATTIARDLLALADLEVEAQREASAERAPAEPSMLSRAGSLTRAGSGARLLPEVA